MTPFLVDAAPVSGRSSGEKSATRGCVLSGGSDETDGGATPSSWPVCDAGEAACTANWLAPNEIMELLVHDLRNG
eukprot:6173591-Pleurochrysis_carterae.AAC.2